MSRMGPDRSCCCRAAHRAGQRRGEHRRYQAVGRDGERLREPRGAAPRWTSVKTLCSAPPASSMPSMASLLPPRADMLRRSASSPSRQVRPMSSPGCATLQLEVRDLEMAVIDRLCRNIYGAGRETICRRHRHAFPIHAVYRAEPVTANTRIQDVIERAARGLGRAVLRPAERCQPRRSRIAKLAPMGMTFIQAIAASRTPPMSSARLNTLPPVQTCRSIRYSSWTEQPSRVTRRKRAVPMVRQRRLTNGYGLRPKGAAE